MKITFFARIAHGREVFERQDAILEIDQLGINMEDNIMSQRTGGIISLFSKVIKKSQRTTDEYSSNRVINPSSLADQQQIGLK